MFLKLNWIGIHVADFEASLRFYTNVLGLNATDKKPDWAYIETTGMTFELFGGWSPPTPSQSAWGYGQSVRPGIQVANLNETVTVLRQRGVEFTGEIEKTAFGEMIEFMAPENKRWTLAYAPSLPFGLSLNKTHIGWIELKANRIAEQRTFYNKVLGLQPENGQGGKVILTQGLGEPILLLEPGGQQAAPFQIEQNTIQPMPSHLMSVETDHIEEAAAWLKSQGVPILTEITHKDWGGIDLYITDPDGNPIQVVQYVQA